MAMRGDLLAHSISFVRGTERCSGTLEHAHGGRTSRGSVDYLLRTVSEADLAIMRRDRLHLEFPSAGSRMLRGLLAAEGVQDRTPACEDADAEKGG
jgi:hypothetical protein